MDGASPSLAWLIVGVEGDDIEGRALLTLATLPRAEEPSPPSTRLTIGKSTCLLCLRISPTQLPRVLTVDTLADGEQGM